VKQVDNLVESRAGSHQGSGSFRQSRRDLARVSHPRVSHAGSFASRDGKGETFASSVASEHHLRVTLKKDRQVGGGSGATPTSLMRVFEERFHELDDAGSGVITIDEFVLHLGHWVGDEDEDQDEGAGKGAGGGCAVM